MIFNVYAGLQVALVALPAGLVYGVTQYGLGWDTAAWWAAFVGALCLFPVDLVTRLSAMRAVGEEGEEPPGAMAFVRPGSGGHLMFLPMWAMGGVVGVLLLLGVVNP